jgi:hypothetical protein
MFHLRVTQAMGEPMQRLVFAALGAIGLAWTTHAAADEIRRETVRFAPGKTSATSSSRFKGYDSVEYTLAAEAGQRLTVTFKARGGAPYFNVLAPGNPEALFNGSVADNPDRFEGKLPVSGDYVVQVYQMRASARRGETVHYTITFAIDGKVALDSPPKADFADSLSGGPDYWQVAGVPAGDVLNLRKSPSARAPVVATANEGAALRNAGCRIVGGQRWCRVETTAGGAVTGWVAGKYLREGPGPAAAATGGLPAGLDLAAECRRFAAVDFLVKPSRIRTAATGPGPEGFLVDATADLGRQGRKPFACRFDRTGRYLGIMSKVDEGAL